MAQVSARVTKSGHRHEWETMDLSEGIEEMYCLTCGKGKTRKVRECIECGTHSMDEHADDCSQADWS